MARRTISDLTDMIRKLETDLAVARADLESLEYELERGELVRLRERVAVLESQLAEMKKREEEFDRRRWQVTVLFFGSLLTLAVQLTILFVKK